MTKPDLEIRKEIALLRQDKKALQKAQAHIDAALARKNKELADMEEENILEQVAVTVTKQQMEEEEEAKRKQKSKH